MLYESDLNKEEWHTCAEDRAMGRASPEEERAHETYAAQGFDLLFRHSGTRGEAGETGEELFCFMLLEIAVLEKTEGAQKGRDNAPDRRIVSLAFCPEGPSWIVGGMPWVRGYEDAIRHMSEMYALLRGGYDA